MKIFLFFILFFYIFNTANSNELTSTHIDRIIDADTIVVSFMGVHSILGEKISVRLYGIDTPEKRTKCLPEKSLALKASAFVKNLVNSAKDIKIIIKSRGKYYRLIGELYLDGVNVSSLLINAGYAVPYFGGTKTPWCEILTRRYNG